VYLIKQDAVQPDFWLALAAQGNIDGCKQKLAKP